jgi:transposase
MDLEKINHSNEQMYMNTNNRNVRLQQRVVLLNPLSPELNLICYLLALLARDFLHVSRIRVK